MEKTLIQIEKNTRPLPQIPIEVEYKTNEYRLDLLDSIDLSDGNYVMGVTSFNTYNSIFNVTSKNNKIEYFDGLNWKEIEFEITPFFFNCLSGNKTDFTQLSDEEKEALVEFVEYAGGLGRDVKSNLYKTVKYIKESQYQNIEGQGTTFIFLSSDPNTLVERLEVLVGESFAGNKNAYREASAILAELLRMEEITKLNMKRV